MKRNPTGWRWRLVLWLTGGVIEAVPINFHGPVRHTGTIVVSLGQPGALNTADYRS